MIEPNEYTLDDYQSQALSLAVYPPETALEYCLLQLASEAGEAAGKLGKALRKKAPVDKEALAYELGDTLWYVANAAEVLGYDLSMIAEMNIAKLQDRSIRGVIHGDGDNR
jgi:NTP pyrophosphatase (non-canonical NTP hydrolase)